MKRAVLTPDPPRLIELRQPYAELIARGNREFATPEKESAHFCRTHATKPHPRLGPRLFLSVALAAAALVALTFGLTAQRQPALSHTIDAERHAAPSPAVTARTVADPMLGDASQATLGGSSNAESSHERDTPEARPPRVRRPNAAEIEPAPLPDPTDPKPLLTEPAPSLPDTAPRPDCRDHARSGESRKAEACYLDRSKGSGLDAETAFLEIARLRRDVLDDPSGALLALEDYRQRFPSGALRYEADTNHAVLLARLGRSSEALAETERLLDSPQGRERAFELRLLRGHVYRKALANTALAAREYEAAEKLERANSESSYLLGSCLEELGDAAGARAAYHRYLERSPTGKRATEVKKRLGALAP